VDDKGLNIGFKNLKNSIMNPTGFTDLDWQTALLIPGAD
jgi:hypothetical protein